MLDSDFWRDICAQFLSIQVARFRLSWVRGADGNMRYEFPDSPESTFLQFRVLAQRAGHQLAPGDAVPFTTWMDKLIDTTANERPGKHLASDGVSFEESGSVMNVGVASANLCRMLESNALQLEHARNLERTTQPSAVQAGKMLFPFRAAWVKERLRERDWDRNRPQEFGGPDHKTMKRILNGHAVHDGTIDKLITALNKLPGGKTIVPSDVPND